MNPSNLIVISTFLDIIDVDDCALNPCMNGATCTDLLNDYNCSCVGSWKGKNCDWITGELVSDCSRSYDILVNQTFFVKLTDLMQ